MNGCCYGCESNLPWAVHFPQVLGLRHPTQLYASGLALLVAVFLLWFLQRKRYDGQIFAFGLLYYGAYRFLIEFLRVNPRYFLGLSEAQWIAILVIAAAVFLLTWLPRRSSPVGH
jgi:phosphatidylglycerol:prolipoprotein diacylglycerol transferase